MEVIPMTKSMKETVLSKHNEARNRLAGGKVPKYPTASRMREIVSTLLHFCNMKS